MTRSHFLFFTILITTVLFAGCGNKYRVEREGMPDALRIKLEQQVEKGRDLLTKATTDAEKIEAELEIAFGNDQLGRFDLAIPHYEAMLNLESKNFQALNNLGVIYEEVGEYEKSAQYYGKLLNDNPNNTEVLSDAIRALVSARHLEDAQKTLENFARAHSKDVKYTKLISDLYESIVTARNANSTKNVQ